VAPARHLAAALAAAIAGAPPRGLDKAFLDAAVSDAREALSAVYSAIASDMLGEGVRVRSYSLCTRLGAVTASYPYAPGRGGFRDVRALLGGGRAGEAKATASARELLAGACARLGSFGEAAAYAALASGVSVSAGTARKICLAEAAKVERALDAGTAAREPQPRRPLPKGARAVPPTVAVFADGTCAPCVARDTRGVAGRNGGEAGSRELKVLAAVLYDHVDGAGRPIVRRGDAIYRATWRSAAEAGPMLRQMADELAGGAGVRLQFMTDGAAWAENMHGAEFCDAVRSVDFYHGCQYLHEVVAAAVPAARVRQVYGIYRATMMRRGAAAMCGSLLKNHGKKLTAPDFPAANAFRYLTERQDAMDYGNLRRQGLFIGSGLIESACKFIVGARCKQAGMHWRHRNAAAVANLRAALRSFRKLPA